MAASDLVQKLETLRPRLENEGVRHLILFGSQARGTANAQSDIDIAIDVEPQSRFSILNAFMRRSLDQEFRTELDRDGIEIF
mgnify:CR=1 FL=1